MRDFETMLAGGMLIFFVLILLASILLAVLYLLNLQNVLKEVQPHNRQVEPGNVWLMFIPLFNIIYPFILYPRISDSVSREYAERGLPADGNFGRSIGITMPILSLTGWVPLLGPLGSLANLVLWIIFWTKMAKYKNTLRTSPVGGKVAFSTNVELID